MLLAFSPSTAGGNLCRTLSLYILSWILLCKFVYCDTFLTGAHDSWLYLQPYVCSAVIHTPTHLSQILTYSFYITYPYYLSTSYFILHICYSTRVSCNFSFIALFTYSLISFILQNIHLSYVSLLTMLLFQTQVKLTHDVSCTTSNK